MVLPGDDKVGEAKGDGDGDEGGEDGGAAEEDGAAEVNGLGHVGDEDLRLGDGEFGGEGEGVNVAEALAVMPGERGLAGVGPVDGGAALGAAFGADATEAVAAVGAVEIERQVSFAHGGIIAEGGVS